MSDGPDPRRDESTPWYQRGWVVAAAVFAALIVGWQLGGSNGPSEPEVADPGTDVRETEEAKPKPQPKPKPQLTSKLLRCHVDTNDGTITGAVSVTNRSSTTVEVEAGLLFYRTSDNTRVGDGYSYTTAKPRETVELSIIGSASSYPQFVGDGGYECKHEAQVVD